MTTHVPITFVSRFNLQVVKEIGEGEHHSESCHVDHSHHHHHGCCHEDHNLKQPSCGSHHHHHSGEGHEHTHHHHHHYNVSSISVLFMGLKDGSVSLFAPGASSLTQFSLPQQTTAISNIIQISHKIISDIDEDHLSNGTPNSSIEKRIKKISCKNYFASISENDGCVKFWKIYAKEKTQKHQYNVDNKHIELAPTSYIDFSMEMIDTSSQDAATFESPIVALGNSHDLIYAISERGEVGVWKFGLMSGKIIRLSKFNLGRMNHKVKSVSSSRKDRCNPNRLLSYSFIAVAWEDGMIAILEPNYRLVKNRISSIGLEESHQDFQFNRLFVLKMVIHAFSASIALAVDTHDETEESTYSEEVQSEQELYSYPFESPLNNITYELHLVTLPENSEHLHVLIKQGGDYLIRVFNTAESVPLTSDHLHVEGALRTMEEEFATEAMREGIHDKIFHLKFVGERMIVSSQDLIEIYSRLEDSSTFCSLIHGDHDEEEEATEEQEENVVGKHEDDTTFELSSIEFDGRRALLLGCTDGKIRGVLVPSVVHSHLGATTSSMSHLEGEELETFEVEMPKHCIRK
ncbi:hypothetical protein C9374_012407 [Naegleria lovaniensis]|uniref:Uncharacterized protein n=1 Tax=Naegleria lovaniensis TaxID=51637 RepID=A0AA88KVW6_NAELO|nr:uncharacterized protein C9374_012407 [Naegleria lovaniensis]KAG2392155.1 hypothetical protein C9374_012407 [Naegleria lovaniensis]